MSSSEDLLTDTPPKSMPTDRVTGEAPKKRGRPPLGTVPPKPVAEVEQALAVMQNAYDFLAMGLMLVGAVEAAGSLADKVDYVQTQNRGFFMADRKLAQSIAKVGATSGRAGFVVTNFMVLAPVAIEAAPVIRSKFFSAPVAQVRPVVETVSEVVTPEQPLDPIYPPVVSE